MVGNRMTLMVATLALGLASCVSGEPGSRDRRILGLEVKPPPQDTRPSEARQRQRPGLVSGDDGALTIYRKSDRGSSDPTKPEKVKR